MERQQRYRAQAELLRVQTEANLALERKVQERTSELQEANSRLQEVSATDGLTQVRNRHFFDEKLALEWSQNARGNSQLSLLLIDGDHFKAINDTYGHLCGDAMLKHIARIFNATVKRAGDFVARYGGEEFTILLCHTDLMGAARVAQKICEEVASQPLQWEGKSIHFTVSIGVANRQPNRDEDPKSLLREADAALYQAKETGRNRVMLFTKTVTKQGVVEKITPYPLPESSTDPAQTTASKPSNFG
ncbi:MAG TPA: diguanylate cyclase [Dongiaceae bacterium]|nr:diguanylate cyclase [Dongiaceae bacterium]